MIFHWGILQHRLRQRLNEAIKQLVDETDPLVLHGYMDNAGYPDVRQAVAENLNKRFGTAFTSHNIVMTVGAAED